MSWPEALDLLSVELRKPVTLRVAVEHEFLGRLIDAGVPRGRQSFSSRASGRSSAARTTTRPTHFQQITCRPPRPVAEFLHEYRAEFVK